MENKKKKIIIIGHKEMVSPNMIENIHKRFGEDCEIELMTKEEYQSLYAGFVELALEKEQEVFELCLRRMDLQDYLPAELSVAESPKPDFPKKIGKANNKKLSPQQKQFEKRRRAR